MIPTTDGGWAIVGTSDGFDELVNDAYIIKTNAGFDKICPSSADFTMSEDSICLGDWIRVENITAASNTPEWSIEGSSAGNAWDTIWTFNVPGSYDILLELTGCFVNKKRELTVLDLPDTDFGFSVSGPTVDFTMPAGVTPSYFQWSFGDGTINTSDMNPTHYYGGTGGDYYAYLYIIDEHGCENYDSSLVTINPSGIERIELESDQGIS